VEEKNMTPSDHRATFLSMNRVFYTRKKKKKKKKKKRKKTKTRKNTKAG